MCWKKMVPSKMSPYRCVTRESTLYAFENIHPLVFAPPFAGLDEMCWDLTVCGLLDLPGLHCLGRNLEQSVWDPSARARNHMAALPPTYQLATFLCLFAQLFAGCPVPSKALASHISLHSLLPAGHSCSIRSSWDRVCGRIRLQLGALISDFLYGLLRIHSTQARDPAACSDFRCL